MPVEMDYTNRDYDSIRSFLVTVARERMPEWVTVGEPADMGTLLLELFAFAEDVTNYYIDRAAAEAFLRTAVRRQSVLAIADLFNYKPISRQAAMVELTFRLDETAFTSSNVEIPVNSLVRIPGRTDVVYETTAPLVLGVLVRSGTVLAAEGRTINEEFVGASNGAPLQVFPLLSEGVIERSLFVEVEEADGRRTAWTFVNYLASSAPDASVYTTVLDDLGNVILRFGDNVHGRIPATSARIFATYRTGAGEAGNAAEYTITEMVAPIPGVAVVNNGPATGGADPESLDALRESIPRSTRTLDRAVTLADYAALAMQVPGVSKAIARGDYYTSIYINIAPVGGGLPPDGLRAYVQSYVQARSLVGVTLQVDDPEYLDLLLDITVHVRHEYGQLTTRTQVEDALRDLFSFERANFGEAGRVTLGSIYLAAHAVPGVAYITINAFHPVGQPNPSPLEDVVPGDIEIPRLRPEVRDATGTVTQEWGLTLTMQGGLV